MAEGYKSNVECPAHPKEILLSAVTKRDVILFVRARVNLGVLQNRFLFCFVFMKDAESTLLLGFIVEAVEWRRLSRQRVKQPDDILSEE